MSKDIGVSVEVERPVTIKADGKTIRLTESQARELAQKINAAVGGYPTYPTYYPYYPYSGTYTTIGGDYPQWTSMSTNNETTIEV